MEKQLYIFDIEGTLSHKDWREHLLPDYAAFWAEFPRDKPIVHMVYLAQMLLNKGHEIVILTGMPIKYKQNALIWLNRYGLGSCQLIMKTPEYEQYSTAEFKFRCFKNYFGDRELTMLFDDQRANVEIFLNNNLQAVQV